MSAETKIEIQTGPALIVTFTRAVLQILAGRPRRIAARDYARNVLDDFMGKNKSR
jgi:hypothetical protein